MKLFHVDSIHDCDNNSAALFSILTLGTAHSVGMFIKTCVFADILLLVRAQHQHRRIACRILFGYLLDTM